MERLLLTGDYPVMLDAKNRVAVPARLRPAFAAGIVVTFGDDGCLAGFTEDGFLEDLARRAADAPVTSAKGRAVQRLHASQAVNQSLDTQGRITLSARHLAHAGITREVTIIGAWDHLEIWDRAKWVEYMARNEEEADATADELAAL